MSTEQVRWRRHLGLGLIWGAAAVFLAIVGLVETFAPRAIIVGVISLGHAMLLTAALGGGYQAAQRVAGGRLGPALTSGMLVGGVVAVALAALVLLGGVVNLRRMLVAATPTLYSLLSFGRGTAGAVLLLPVGVGTGLVGAAVARLSARLRGPLIAGVAMAFFVGLFQELFQIILQEGTVQSLLRELFFETDGLTPRGAMIIFALTVAGQVAWARQGRAVRARLAGLPPGQRRVARALAVTATLLLLWVIPAVVGPFLSQVMVIVGLYTLMGLGLNLEVGFAGLLDLGFVAFFAIGAYTVGLLTSTGAHGLVHLSFWAAVPIAVVVSLIAGVLLGVPVLRIRGDYLAIATLGFGEITRLLVLSDFLRPWLGGSQGVLGIPKPVLGGFEFAGPEQLFYLTLVCSLLVAYVGWRLRDSRLGRAWMALREDEDVAEAMGINLVNIKLLAYGLGAAFAGVSGAIFAVMVQSVFPHSFSIIISINVLALIIVGGMGSQPGVIVGSLFLVGMPELLREFADFRFLVYGAVLVLMMQMRPEGLWPAAALRRELREANEAGADADEAPEASPAAGGGG